LRQITVQAGSSSSANAAGIAASQTPSAGVVFTLTANPVIVDTTAIARRVVITTGNETSPRAVTLTGTNRSGQTQSETITIRAATAGTYGSALDFLSVTSLVSNTSFTAAVTVGTIATGSGSSPTVGSSAWVSLDSYGLGPVSFAVDVTNAGDSISLTVDQSSDSPNDVFPLVAVPPALMTWVTPPDAGRHLQMARQARLAPWQHGLGGLGSPSPQSPDLHRPPSLYPKPAANWDERIETGQRCRAVAWTTGRTG
jgi:hypothetical protein